MPDHQPAWSPDGRRVAFARQDPADGTRDLHEATLDGQVTRLTTLRLHTLHGLAYLADGEDLVLSSTRQDSRVLLRWQRHGRQLLPLGLEGSAPKRNADGRIVHALMRSHVSIARLAPGAAAPQRHIQSVASDRAPDVHAASGRTVFVSRRSGTPELWLDAADGQPPRQLTRLDGLVAAPVWSPDGDQVAFLGHCGTGRRAGLCLLEVASGALRALSSDATGYGRPAWHPDGRSVWLASDRGGTWQLWRFDALTGAEPEVHRTEALPGRALHWLADGSALVYQVRGQPLLRVRPAAGGAERVLAPAPAGEVLVDWRLQAGAALTLSRGGAEWLRRVPLDGRAPSVLSRQPLGTFPEFATVAPAGGDTVLIELANASDADLMQTR